MPQELTNLLIPFRRDKKRDFASGTGPDILRSKVLQTLLTQGATSRSSGELPWRTAFGAGLEISAPPAKRRGPGRAGPRSDPRCAAALGPGS